MPLLKWKSMQVFLTAYAALAPAAGRAQSAIANADVEPPCAPAGDMLTAKPFLDRIVEPGHSFSLSGIPVDVLAKVAATAKAQVDQQAKDWPNLCRYRDQNEAVAHSATHPRVIFLGDSITEFWQVAQPDYFTDQVLDRGISGQTTPQILLRFYQDVVALHPLVVHIMAGTNDVAANTGLESDETILNNIRSMIDLAQSNHIRVVLASIPPTKAMNWRPNVKPAERIQRLNRQLRAIAAGRHVV